MSSCQQVLKKIIFHRLKNLVGLEVDFFEKPLVAILGPNGIGKSTILHALACVNRPVVGREGYKFSDFFVPTTNSSWEGSGFDVYQDYRDGAKEINDHMTNFRKDRDRWAPRYSTRVERYVSFIGVKTCVPAIENETQKSRISFRITNLTDKQSSKVKELAGQVLNKNYDNYAECFSKKKKYVGVEVGPVRYSSLSMGAGEQRVFYILSEVVKAPSNGLVLVDEIDLLLHKDALLKLMRILNDLATRKKLQIIFTTHSHALLELDFIATRHLYQTPLKTLCFKKTTPDALHRLTGDVVKKLEIFVKDDLAESLARKVCDEMGVLPCTSIIKFGAAVNCFTAVCGSLLSEVENQENMLFLLDGDVYRTSEEKVREINKVLTGTDERSEGYRQIALTRIRQFVLPEGEKPEAHYHSIICDLDVDKLSVSESELKIIEYAKYVSKPEDDHGFLNSVVDYAGYGREVGLSRLVDLICLSEEWKTIVEEVKAWIDERKSILNL